MNNWSELIFLEDLSFKEKAKQVFEYQFENNAVYHRYCEVLNTNSEILKGVQDDISAIPLLPIKAFKDAVVTTHSEENADLIFKSSGTSDMRRSIHRVHDSELYDQSLLKGFRHFYNLDNAVIWGYPPGYADNPHSSLIYMIQKLIDQDNSGLSRFLPLGEPVNPGAIKEVQRQGKQLIIFGAAFGLLDLLEIDDINLPSNSIVIETGGMKTHRREISRSELHRRLAKGFGLDGSRIHSEYGMAELLSQAYAPGKWFSTVPWMQVTIRNPENLNEILPPYEEGLIGVIDLANVHSCSFLLTGDKGVMDKDGRFQVLGRWNPKNLRGCNFLIDED
ncbi:LuxE/PaaK family acyltransferase [Fodinibius sp. AD559]|uniref:LuxE/PaaK family acyltransferase n=1 Tax=Fodinibius sp. AD559 TaxID=3424179 RepID=UPI004046A218